MRKVVIAMLAVGSFAALGCDEKKPEAKPATSAAATSTAAAKASGTPATPAPAKTAAPAGGGW